MTVSKSSTTNLWLVSFLQKNTTPWQLRNSSRSNIEVDAPPERSDHRDWYPATSWFHSDGFTTVHHVIGLQDSSVHHSKGKFLTGNHTILRHSDTLWLALARTSHRDWILLCLVGIHLLERSHGKERNLNIGRRTPQDAAKRKSPSAKRGLFLAAGVTLFLAKRNHGLIVTFCCFCWQNLDWRGSD